MSQHIRLRGIGGEIDGRTWENDKILRVGRLPSLEIVLDDNSVSRKHAEIRATESGWFIRDLGSTNGTTVNGTRLGTEQLPVSTRDVIRCGIMTLLVETCGNGKNGNGKNGNGKNGTDVAHENTVMQTTTETVCEPSVEAPANERNMVIEASEQKSWSEAFDSLIFDKNRSPRPGEQLVALLRAGHHLGSIETEDELLRRILGDAVSTLSAQRGAIVLADKPQGPLRLRCVETRNNVPSRPSHSDKYAWQSFVSGKGILCQSVDDVSRSIAEGEMSSIICVVLRTPRKRLGVLHLDRGPTDMPFTKEDLRLADALAASVSAGIECAQLLRKQQEMFYSTITVLADAVELRDKDTGQHTRRVTEYSVLLGETLGLTQEELTWIRRGAPLHDIGKIGIRDSILAKPGALTMGEFEEMKKHTIYGATILQQIPELAPAIPIVRSHHERWDGKGYPDGLSGDNIPLIARIVAVADAFDAMTMDRPYRKSMIPELAFKEVRKQSGKQFDPKCAEAFLSISDRIVEKMASVNKKSSGNTTVKLVPTALNTAEAK